MDKDFWNLLWSRLAKVTEYSKKEEVAREGVFEWHWKKMKGVNPDLTEEDRQAFKTFHDLGWDSSTEYNKVKELVGPDLGMTETTESGPRV